MFDSIRETIDYSVEHDISFADILINEEMEREGISRDEVRERMKQNLEVMRDAVEKVLLRRCRKCYRLYRP